MHDAGKYRPSGSGNESRQPTFSRAGASPAPRYCFLAGGQRSADGRERMESCEDAEPIIERLADGRVFACVADGLGGYSQGFDGKSGGYIASRAVSRAALDYFAHAAAYSADRHAASLTGFLYNRLRRLSREKMPESRIKGTLGRHRLASTLACMVIDDGETGAAATLYWIGDSRIYFFDAKGLKQLTRDDTLVENDAYDGLFDDSPMSQFLAASMDKAWSIHSRKLDLSGPGVLIACTDGCIAYWKRPWDFEIALVEALKKSRDWSSWIEGIQSSLEPIRCDDASFIAYPVNAGLFDDFKSLVLRSRKSSAAACAARIARRGRVSDRAIWQQIYKPSYEKWLPQRMREEAVPPPGPAKKSVSVRALIERFKRIFSALWPFT